MHVDSEIMLVIHERPRRMLKVWLDYVLWFKRPRRNRMIQHYIHDKRESVFSFVCGYNADTDLRDVVSHVLPAVMNT